MNICILTENYYRGGLDTFIINLINNWPNQNDEFTIICNKSHPGLNDIKKRVKKLTKIKRYNFFLLQKLPMVSLINYLNPFFLEHFLDYLIIY